MPPSDSQPTTDEPAPMPRRLSEATAAFLLEFPRGYDLPPLEIIVQQINAALRAADAADAQGRSEATFCAPERQTLGTICRRCGSWAREGLPECPPWITRSEPDGSRLPHIRTNEQNQSAMDAWTHEQWSSEEGQRFARLIAMDGKPAHGK